ncbi:MAG: sugar-binding protein [Kiritimatiellia bacterium]|nr:sugar-binding protein [Kiritimatiellia bacterium]
MGSNGARRSLDGLLGAVLGMHLLAGCASIGRPSRETDRSALPVFSVPRMESVVIDGYAGDWAEDGFRVDVLISDRGREPGQGPMPARQDCSAAARLGWGEDGLLVLLNVTGRDWQEAEKVAELYNGDSVECYLAPYPGAADRCQWLFAPGMDARFPEPRAHLQPFGTTRRLLRDAPRPVVARARTDSGYRLECRLPWSALKIAPGLGDEVAFQVMVSAPARNGRPAAHLLWYPVLGAAHDSRKLHRIRLAEKPDSPVTARASLRVNYREFKTECEVFAPLSAAGREVRLRSEGGVLATGRLTEEAGGYARATLAGPGTGDPVATLDLDGRRADAVPLVLPRAEMAIETRVRLEQSASALTVVLGLPEAQGCRIARRRPDREWQVLTREAPPGAFRDTGVEQETLYEYAVTCTGHTARTDYFWAGSDIPLRERRGTVLLVVERSLAGPLASEIRRLMFDLVGDGWRVSRHDVSAAQTAGETRQWIQAEYDRAPSEVNTVLLLGRVPVPCAGWGRPDGHGVGAWPADVYYGALTGLWSDEKTNGVGRKRKDPTDEGGADGKLDQQTIPGPVQLAVGRVDLSRLPAFGADEISLLRRYLDRHHAYRQARLPVADRALIHDGFPGHVERFAYSGWQNFTTLLDPEKVLSVTWPNITPGAKLLFFGCGPGHPESIQTFGDIHDMVKMPLGGIFTMLFGSCVGDWNTRNNLMRAALAHERGALTCGWGGRPHWVLHPMGMGETIGDCLRRTQNNDGRDYQPVGSFARGTHIALMGDPTLRLHRVAPPSNLQIRDAGRGMGLSWAGSPRKVVGYHVYRARSEFGPYARLTERPVTALTFDDPDGTPEHCYQVRAIALQRSTTGTYYNSSQGAFAGVGMTPVLELDRSSVKCDAHASPSETTMEHDVDEVISHQ